MKTKAHKTQVLLYTLMRLAAQGALVVSLVAMVSVVCFVFIRGIPYIDAQLLFGDYGKLPSIKPALVGTLYLVGVAIALAAPLGIGSAIFLAEYTGGKSRLVRMIRVATETLAGIPSIVYGIFGYLVFVIALGFRYSLIGGGLTLAIMVLPVIVRSTEESLLAVPLSLREGSVEAGNAAYKDIVIDDGRHTITANGISLRMTLKEYNLLCFLCRNAEKVQPREAIFAEVWGDSFVGETRTLDIHIKELRKKLAAAESRAGIKTIRGVGYMLT